MEEIKKEKFEQIKNAVLRWSVFFAALIAIFIVIQLSAAFIFPKLYGAPKVKLPVFSAEEILQDPQARMIYLAPRVRGVHFSVYKIQPKDNLWKLAGKYGYSVHTIIGCNPQLTTYNVNTNQKILIPSAGGSLHPVRKGDSWEKIAEKYDIETDVLKFENYGVSSFTEGDFIFIPGRKPAIDLMNESMQEKYSLRSLFVSPLGGRLSSVFGKRKHPVTGKVSLHGGIDIAVKSGTWVGAAADGVVILASYDAGHYGTAVFIDHQNGYITHYGHLSSINVRVGQRVKAHQLIGKSGATGRVTGPHLHFTVKKGNTSIDPLKFLW
ncbi:M23 family metallopeptidase [Endomicrobium proavitum]|uniref:LysM domain-containing protein n=1 Tax=Endomicrobium proavitum TaxID=1408281 RepID=A0A0G3WL30_9BACT|nr:M23 family metallopeptidase [Endomicrobium proavitum]AKL98209.1 hypothetical protein Epro_0830 [Endomicrobium proavitum]